MAQPVTPMPRCTAADQPLRLLSEADYAAQVRKIFADRQAALSADPRKAQLARSLGHLDSSQQTFNPRAAHQLLSLRDEQQSRLLRDEFAGAPGPLQESPFERQRRIWASTGIGAARLSAFGPFGQRSVPGAEPMLQFRNDRPIIAKRLDDLMMVVGDSENVVDGLVGAEPGRPYVIVDAPSGRCYRPMVIDDLAVDQGSDTTGTLAIIADGFREIAMIARQSDDSVRPWCTAVLVGTAGDDAYLLTAAHCVQAKRTPHAPDAVVSHPALAEKFRVLLPLGGASTPASGPPPLASCFAPPASAAVGTCPYRLGTIVDPARFVPAVMIASPWVGQSLKQAVPDIALLTVRFDGGSVALPAPAMVQAYSSAPVDPPPFWLVQGGYGVGSAGSGRLVVAPWAGAQAPGPNNLGFAKLDHDQPGFVGSRACSGDSGGPLYQGYFYGHPDETSRPLVALVSSVVDGETAEDCRQSSFQLIQTITPDIKTWLCGQQSTISGCSNP